MITPATSDLAIDLRNVQKVYKGKVHALRGIEMQVRRGEIFGFLGPNGAGKSTLVKILMTVISPTRADGTVLGMPVGHKPTLARVGYLPEHHRFPDYLTGAQVLDFYGAMSGVRRKERKFRQGELLTMVGMQDWAKAKVKSYSKGMRQRIGLAQALMNDPDLVVLDEPTDGVDPVGRRDIRNMLAHLRDEGHTVFLNSHLLSELEMVCDRVAILVQGKVSSQGTIDELTRDSQRYEIEIVADSPAAALDLWRGVLPAPPAAPPVPVNGAPPPLGMSTRLESGERLETAGHILRVGSTDPAAVQPIIDRLRSRGIAIRGVRQFRPSLEDLFMQAVTDPNTGAALAPGAVKGARS